jgi:hypothetical protein
MILEDDEIKSKLDLIFTNAFVEYRIENKDKTPYPKEMDIAWNKHLKENFGCKSPKYDRGTVIAEKGYIEVNHSWHGDSILVPCDFAEKVLVLGGLP